jgi:VWFA-related protein
MCLAQSGGEPTQNPQEITTRDSHVTFATAVNLVMVPVVVRDAKGHAVGTLHQEDFRLFDKGRLQTITKFSIEKTNTPSALLDTSIQTDAGGSPPPGPIGTPTAQPIARHFLAWLFDDVHLSFGDLAQSRAAALRLLKEPFEPGTRVAIYTTSGHVTLDFTGTRTGSRKP